TLEFDQWPGLSSISREQILSFLMSPSMDHLNAVLTKIRRSERRTTRTTMRRLLRKTVKKMKRNRSSKRWIGRWTRSSRDLWGIHQSKQTRTDRKLKELKRDSNTLSPLSPFRVPSLYLTLSRFISLCLSSSPSVFVLFWGSDKWRTILKDPEFSGVLYLRSNVDLKVGACLVSQNGVILGIGYNGFPRGCSDDRLPWAKKSKTGNPLETKYPYVCHAEVNAILNTNHTSAAGQKLYVTMYPCNECAKIIIQSGVTEVIYFVENRLNDSDIAYVASHMLLAMANIKVRKHQPHMDQILIKFQDDLL
ncbi:unnamed protein product, partial [Thlaspi arvense]